MITSLIEHCFRNTEGYRHALTLYHKQHDLTGYAPTTLLRELIEKRLRGDSRKPEEAPPDPVADAEDWLRTNSRTEAQREKYASTIERIREIQGEADEPPQIVEQVIRTHGATV